MTKNILKVVFLGIILIWFSACGDQSGVDLGLAPASEETSSSQSELTASRVTITNPHQNYPSYYKGQTHDHSTRSDGRNSPNCEIYLRDAQSGSEPEGTVL